MTADAHNTTNDDGLEEFIDCCHEALAQQAKGHPEPFLALWSHTEDVTIFAAAGGHETGFDRVSALLTAVSKTLNWETWSAENLSTRIDGNLAVTVELEHRTRQVEGQEQETVLRVTQIYRRGNEGWSVVHRQGDLLTPYSVKW